MTEQHIMLIFCLLYINALDVQYNSMNKVVLWANSFNARHVVGHLHGLNGYESEQTPGDSE